MADYSQVDLTVPQTEAFNSIILELYGRKRFSIMRWGRRGGKNFKLLVSLAYVASTTNTTSMFIGKTSSSTRKTAFEPFRKFCNDQLGKNHGIKFNASTLEVHFPERNGKAGSEILFRTAEALDTLRGGEIDGILCCDEIDFWGPPSNNVFMKGLEDVLRPMTSQTQAKIIITSTPFGVGFPLHKMWLRGEKDPENYYLSHVTAYEAGTLPQSEIDGAKKDMNPNSFAQEYMAEFVSASSRVYPHFGDGNMPADMYDRQVELFVGLDHNVAQSTAVIAQVVGDTVEIIDEIKQENSNTRTMAISIKARYPGRSITVFPDPSGKARKTSAPIGETDHTILEQEGLTVISPSKAPLIVDRINLVNDMIYNGVGERRLFIDKEACPTLVDAVSFHLNDLDKKQPIKGGIDKYDDTNDSLGYMIWGLFSDRLAGGKTQSVQTNDFYG